MAEPCCAAERHSGAAYGDVPADGANPSTWAPHTPRRAVLTAIVDRPHGWGIVRSGEQIARIVEERDASSAEREIREITPAWRLALDGLFDAVRTIAPQNAQQEYYLTDLVAVYRGRGLGVETVTVSNADEIRGINSRTELAEVSRIVRQKTNDALMAAGVTIEDPATTYIDEGVQIGADTIIHPGVAIEGRTAIGAGCEIHSGVRIVDSRIGDRVTVLNHCVITSADCDEAKSAFAHPAARSRRPPVRTWATSSS